MEDQENQNCALGHSAIGAVKTGKTVTNAAKYAAACMTGSPVAAASVGKKLLIPAAALLILPIVLLAMLPIVLFGTLFGDGTDEKSGMADGAALSATVTELNTGISGVLSEGLADVLARIESDFQTSGCDSYEVNNPYGADVRYNANAFMCLYCASKDSDVESISKRDMLSVMQDNKDKLYSYTYTDETREETVEPDPDSEDSEPETKTVTVRVYTIWYNGEAYFGDAVFALSEDQKRLAEEYAGNLSLLLRDGNYQGLSQEDYLDYAVNYAGVVFTDGSTPVVYYNQLDERWKDAPYGTDDIGHYGCGPTSMAIVVSSLTSDTVDPPHMAQWAYENGHWCSRSGSYNSIVTGAAEAWGLTVDPCSRTNPQKLADALAGGKLAVAIMGPGHFTSRGHFIVLRGITAGGKVLVADPASRSRSGKEWDISLIMSESSVNAANNCPFWIISNGGG